MQKSFDFAILGDQQPEGLLLAAGLARRSYRVCIVPSPVLGELPPLEAWPLRWPEKIGDRKLDELLFKVGFFKLEEAGLEPEADHLQILLKRHRISFDGSLETTRKEFSREFPRFESEWRRVLQDQNFNQSLTTGLEIGKDCPEFSRLVELDSAEGRPTEKLSQKEAMRRCLQKYRATDRRFYRLKPQGDLPYNHFLIEHCRKWGVQILEEPLKLEKSWRSFQLSANSRATHIVVNSLGAARLSARFRKDLSTEKLTHWMYFDRLMSSVDLIPEPLAEFSYLSLEDSEPVLLRVERDRLRDRATVTLGIWLPFQDSRQWETLIEKARAQFKKLAPFIPESAYRQIPSPLELNEMKGECVRRAELDRLTLTPPTKRAWPAQGFWSWLRSKFGSANRPQTLHSRVMVTASFLDPNCGRAESLAECLRAVEYFERKIQRNWVPGRAAKAAPAVQSTRAS